MKTFKRILRILSILLIITGFILMFTAYFPNRSYLHYLWNLIKEANLTHAFQTFSIGILLIVVAIILFGITFKIKVKKKEEVVEVPQEVQEEPVQEQITHE